MKRKRVCMFRHIKYAHELGKRLSDQERRQALLECRSHFLKPGEKAKLYTDIKLPIHNRFKNFIPNPTLVTREVRDDIDILKYKPVSEYTLFMCDFCGSNSKNKGDITKHIELNHNAVKRSDQERRQELLEWRRQYVKPGEKVKLYNEIKLPFRDTAPYSITEPNRATKEIRDDIDIIKYCPEGEEPVYLCDFCGRDYQTRYSTLNHFQQRHDLDQRKRSVSFVRQKLLEWRSPFVIPGDKVKEYTDLSLPKYECRPPENIDPLRVQRIKGRVVDILKYKPENGKEQFICDCCGASFVTKVTAQQHIRRIHFKLNIKS